MRTATVLVVAWLAGCASTTQVLPIGEERYLITADSHTSGLSGTRQEVTQRAIAFCASKRATLDAVTFEDRQGINTYATSLTFKCEQR